MASSLANLRTTVQRGGGRGEGTWRTETKISTKEMEESDTEHVGMMDEETASLRDREPITRGRGGPSV